MRRSAHYAHDYHEPAAPAPCPLQLWDPKKWLEIKEDGTFDAPFTQVLAGSGVGKSSLIKWQLEPYAPAGLDIWDKVIVCSHTAHTTGAYNDVVSNPDRCIKKKFDEDIAKAILKRAQRRKAANEQMLLILDDIMGAGDDDDDENEPFSYAKKKRSSSQKALHSSAAMDRLATERRHLGITVICAEHRFCTLSPTVRENATETFILQQSSMKQIRELADEYSLFQTKHEMVDLILRNTENYQFLVWKRLARTYNPRDHYFVGKAQVNLPPLNIGKFEEEEC